MSVEFLLQLLQDPFVAQSTIKLPLQPEILIIFCTSARGRSLPRGTPRRSVGSSSPLRSFLLPRRALPARSFIKEIVLKMEPSYRLPRSLEEARTFRLLLLSLGFIDRSLLLSSGLMIFCALLLHLHPGLTFLLVLLFLQDLLPLLDLLIRKELLFGAHRSERIRLELINISMRARPAIRVNAPASQTVSCSCDPHPSQVPAARGRAQKSTKV